MTRLPPMISAISTPKMKNSVTRVQKTVTYTLRKPHRAEPQPVDVHPGQLHQRDDQDDEDPHDPERDLRALGKVDARDRRPHGHGRAPRQSDRLPVNVPARPEVPARRAAGSSDVDAYLEIAAAEIEAHVAQAGWDQRPTLFALVRAAQFARDEPDTAAQLGLRRCRGRCADPDRAGGTARGRAGRSARPDRAGRHRLPVARSARRS